MKVTVREAVGFADTPKLPPALSPKKPRGNPDKLIVLAASAAARTGMGYLVLEWRRPGGTDSAEMSQG